MAAKGTVLDASACLTARRIPMKSVHISESDENIQVIAGLLSTDIILPRGRL